MRILFVSPYNYLDLGSGAAISTRELLHEVVRQGHEASTLCGVLFDGVPSGERKERFWSRVRQLEIPVSSASVSLPELNRFDSFQFARFDDGGIRSEVVCSSKERRSIAQIDGFETVDLFMLKRLDSIIQERRPDWFISYGGNEVVIGAALKAKRAGISTAFMLHNLSYKNPITFQYFDKVFVPSDFAREYYERTLGINTTVLAPLINPSKIQFEDNTRKFLTFVNPTVDKGLYFVLGLARELNYRRPDIRIQIVDSRGDCSVLSSIPEARSLKNLVHCPQVEYPALFLRETRIMIVPSLCEESFGRVAVEAGLCGIPTLCSDRGATCDIVNRVDETLVLPVPVRFTATLREITSFEEVKPWFERIVELWDNEGRASQCGESLQNGFQRYSFDAVSKDIQRYFLNPKTQ